MFRNYFKDLLIDTVNDIMDIMMYGEREVKLDISL